MKIVLNASFINLLSEDSSILRKKWMVSLRSQFKDLTFGGIKELGDLLIKETNAFEKGSYAFINLENTSLIQSDKNVITEQGFTLFGDVKESRSALLLDNYEKEPYILEMENNAKREEELKAEILAMISKENQNAFQDKLNELELLMIKKGFAH